MLFIWSLLSLCNHVGSETKEEPSLINRIIHPISSNIPKLIKQTNAITLSCYIVRCLNLHMSKVNNTGMYEYILLECMITLSDSWEDGNIATAQYYRSVTLRNFFFSRNVKV